MRRGSACTRHCIVALKKHELPKFDSPRGAPASGAPVECVTTDDDEDDEEDDEEDEEDDDDDVLAPAPPLPLLLLVLRMMPICLARIACAWSSRSNAARLGMWLQDTERMRR